VHIGIDVGGTNTDAVVVDGRRVLAEVKTPTTADVTSGIRAALRELAFEPAAVSAVMIGTTHFTNAVVERRRRLPHPARPPPAPATPADGRLA
jgi:N-methylhydantoinase A/oxoprolinase/acetone carboxylase beta subunit